MDNYLSDLIELMERVKKKGVVGIKSELEAEGVRLYELSMLHTLVQKQGMLTAIKVGGAEAKTDMGLAYEYGCDYIIAPMIESGYAAKKCVEAFNEKRRQYGNTLTRLLVNIETETAVNNIGSILDSSSGTAAGVVFGRVDYTLSRGLTRDQILSDEVLEAALKVAEEAKIRNMEMVVGGGVSVASITFLKEVRKIRLDRFETRKCIMSSTALDNNSEDLLSECVMLELLWLKFKKSFYESIALEDSARITMLEKRHLYNIENE